ncbi:MAG: DUF5658 family protein [Terriglobia bacterium]
MNLTAIAKKEARALRGSPFFRTVILLVVLNIADLIFSLRAFSRGAEEMNPLMNLLFDTNVYLGSIVKVGVVSAAAKLLLNFRSSVVARMGMTFATTIYAGVFFYHLYFFKF